MATVATLLADARVEGGSVAARDAEILLCAALNKPRTYLMAWPDADVPEEAAGTYNSWLTRRAAGEPVAYLTGEREFWSMPLQVGPATLIPRPETELLVEKALSLKLPGDSRIVDLGTGSGAIALALASERPTWQVSAVDASAEALAIAEANGRRLGPGRVQWHLGSWFEPLQDQRFRLIVSNPPYVAAGDSHLADDVLRFEPTGALIAGDEGFRDLFHIIRQAPDHLERDGWLLLEHGFEQGARVRAAMTEAGFRDVASLRDLAGHERISVGCHAGR